MNILYNQAADFELTKEETESLRLLLQDAFPGYFAQRLYHKQVPSFRFLAKSDKEIIGQVTVSYRAISVDGKQHHIFGILDLCVLPSYRKKGIGKHLIQMVCELAEKSSIRHVFLFADSPEHLFYEGLGFENVSAEGLWLAIDEGRSHGVIEKSMDEILMIKTNDISLFSGKKIDLLGEMF